MKLIILMSLFVVSCGNPHISSKQPPQQMVSPVQPTEEVGGCQEQAQEQQQQQDDYSLIQDGDVLKLKKCNENDVVLDKAENKTTWKFDRPMMAWGTNMPFNSKAKLELFNCKEETLKEFNLSGEQKQVGYSTLLDEVCSVTLTKL